MTRTDSRYERLDDIERKLARRPEGCTTGELAHEFGVDADTIRRDLLLIEGRGTGLIKQGRRYSLDHRRSLHSVMLNNDEALALYLAARLLSRHSDEHNPHVVKALEKLADALESKSPLMAAHIAQAAAAVHARRVRPEYVEALGALTQGWATSHKVRLRYRSSESAISERTFAPYFVEPSGIGYACYVIGFDELRGALREDVILDDIPMLMCGIGAATRKNHRCPEAWRRHMMIVIDGLRAGSASGRLP